ncbi:MAG: hypothetical protein WCK06_09270 [Actinomycetota bacterium]
MTIENVFYEWEEGRRRLARADPADLPALERVIDAVVSELRRRLGGAFSVDELAALYTRERTDWCLDLAIATAPEDPRAWDTATVAEVAFGRYAREAADYAGGRRI